MKILLLFRNTREVIKAEAACRSAGLPLQVIATPKHISSECGMCLQLDRVDGDQALSLIKKMGIVAQLHDEKPPVPAFDLLTTVEYGGCSAKLPPDLLAEALGGFPANSDPRLLVGLDTCDDAGVIKINDDLALIETTDFFPPVCSDAFEFGQIAAANALSDVFAMGGRVLSAMNLVMFPATGIPLEILGEILRGGLEKVVEAGGIIVGGHTIADSPPKYGLAVTGTVHPDRVITNAKGRPGQTLILTKPLGTGVLVAGQRLGEAAPAHYQAALASMKQLNRAGAEIMQKYNVTCATDITGFGLLGHAMHIARASGISLEFNAARLPGLSGACPIGAMQVTVAGAGGLDLTALHTIGARLAAISTSLPLLVIGFLALIGGIVGRAACGWICPFGWFQELLNRIPSPKFNGPQVLKYLKYLILIVFVFLLPAFWLDEYDGGEPSFCKYICPAGTLEGGLPLAYLQPGLRSQLGWLFTWKATLLALLIAAAVFIRRPFCRWVCPLGAFYGPFNKVSLYRIEFEKEGCIECGACSRQCPVSLDVPRQVDQAECLRCLECRDACPKQLLKISRR